MPSTNLNVFTQLKLEPVANADLARWISVLLKPSQTFVRGEILGEIGSTGVYAKYDPNANDGTQLPKALCTYDVVTDANGNPTQVSFPFNPFPGSPTMPVYVRGDFDCATVDTAMGDAGALLAAALNVPGFGALEMGTPAIGVFRMG